MRTEPVARVAESGGAVSGVELASGERLAAGRVVVAAGAWSASLHPALDGLVRPVKGEILRVRARAGSLPPPTRTVRAAVAGRAVYAVPRDGGRLVLGATQYEAGFDADVTVGGVRDLLADTERVLPGIADYALEEAAASFRPGTADNLPVLGAVPGAPDGLLGLLRARPQRHPADRADRRRRRRAARRSSDAGRVGRGRGVPARHPGGVLVTVLLNGVVTEVARGATLADVLTAHGVPERGVAVAVSGEVVPRAMWASTPLREGSVLEVLTAVQGG